MSASILHRHWNTTSRQRRIAYFRHKKPFSNKQEPSHSNACLMHMFLCLSQLYDNNTYLESTHSSHFSWPPDSCRWECLSPRQSKTLRNALLNFRICMHAELNISFLTFITLRDVIVCYCRGVRNPYSRLLIYVKQLLLALESQQSISCFWITDSDIISCYECVVRRDLSWLVLIDESFFCDSTWQKSLACEEILFRPVHKKNNTDLISMEFYLLSKADFPTELIV